MSEYVTDDAGALGVRLCSASRDHSGGEGRHDAERYGPCSLHSKDARALLASGVVRPAADVRAEALEQAADDLAARLDTFLQQGRHTRARWAEQMLRDWAAAMDGAQ